MNGKAQHLTARAFGFLQIVRSNIRAAGERGFQVDGPSVVNARAHAAPVKMREQARAFAGSVHPDRVLVKHVRTVV